MKKTLVTVIIFNILTSLGSCYYDVEEELYPSGECEVAGTTYSADIEPLVRDNCYVCHAANISLGSVTLEGHANIKRLADDGRLLGAISHEPGFSPMPQGEAQLPECDIAKVAQWVSEGAPNN